MIKLRVPRISTELHDIVKIYVHRENERAAAAAVAADIPYSLSPVSDEVAVLI